MIVQAKAPDIDRLHIFSISNNLKYDKDKIT